MSLLFLLLTAVAGTTDFLPAPLTRLQLLFDRATDYMRGGQRRTNHMGSTSTADSVVPTLCNKNERVFNHQCVPCFANRTNAAGDDVSKNVNTLCDPDWWCQLPPMKPGYVGTPFGDFRMESFAVHGYKCDEQYVGAPVVTKCSKHGGEYSIRGCQATCDAPLETFAPTGASVNLHTHGWDGSEMQQDDPYNGLLKNEKNLSVQSFDVNGWACRTPEYEGMATAHVCEGANTRYTLSGCTRSVLLPRLLLGVESMDHHRVWFASRESHLFTNKKHQTTLRTLDRKTLTPLSTTTNVSLPFVVSVIEYDSVEDVVYVVGNGSLWRVEYQGTQLTSNGRREEITKLIDIPSLIILPIQTQREIAIVAGLSIWNEKTRIMTVMGATQIPLLEFTQETPRHVVLSFYVPRSWNDGYPLPMSQVVSGTTLDIHLVNNSHISDNTLLGERRSERRHVAEHNDLVSLGLGRWSHRLLHGFGDETSLTCEQNQECIQVQPKKPTMESPGAIDTTSTSPDVALQHHGLHVKRDGSYAMDGRDDTFWYDYGSDHGEKGLEQSILSFEFHYPMQIGRYKITSWLWSEYHPTEWLLESLNVLTREWHTVASETGVHFAAQSKRSFEVQSIQTIPRTHWRLRFPRKEQQRLIVAEVEIFDCGSDMKSPDGGEIDGLFYDRGMCEPCAIEATTSMLEHYTGMQHASRPTSWPTMGVQFRQRPWLLNEIKHENPLNNDNIHEMSFWNDHNQYVEIHGNEMEKQTFDIVLESQQKTGLDQPFASWTMEPTGTMNTLDVSGNGYHLKISPSLICTPGIQNNAMQFAGSKYNESSYVDSSTRFQAYEGELVAREYQSYASTWSEIPLHPSSGLTISMWMWLDGESTDGDAHLMSTRAPDSRNGAAAGSGSSFYLGISSTGNIQTQIASCTVTTEMWSGSSSPVIVRRKWSHVAVTYDGDVVQHYLNGHKVGELTCGNDLSMFTLLDRNVTATHFDVGRFTFQGKLDSTLVFNFAVPPLSILTLSTNNKDRYSQTTPLRNTRNPKDAESVHKPRAPPMPVNTGMSMAVVWPNDTSKFSYLFAPDALLMGSLRVLSSDHKVSDPHLDNSTAFIEIFSLCPSIGIISLEEKVGVKSYNEVIESNKQSKEKDLSKSVKVPTLNMTILRRNIHLKSGYNSIEVSVPSWVANGTHVLNVKSGPNFATSKLQVIRTFCKTPSLTSMRGYYVDDLKRLGRSTFTNFAFDVAGYRCDENYVGTAVAQVCESPEEEYVLQGCFATCIIPELNSSFANVVVGYSTTDWSRTSSRNGRRTNHVNHHVKHYNENNVRLLRGLSSQEQDRLANGTSLNISFGNLSANPNYFSPTNFFCDQGFVGTVEYGVCQGNNRNFALSGCRDYCEAPLSTVAYNMTNLHGNLKIQDFQPKGVTCAKGFVGKPIFHVCHDHEIHFTVTGCVETCASIVDSTGYNRTNVVEHDLNFSAFQVNGWECDEHYVGTPSVHVCTGSTSTLNQYTLSGCTSKCRAPDVHLGYHQKHKIETSLLVGQTNASRFDVHGWGCDYGFVGTAHVSTCVGKDDQYVLSGCRNTCDMTRRPKHGTIGDCVADLPSGLTCQPTCHSGYENKRNGFRSCLNGIITNTFECTGKPCYNAEIVSPLENGTLGTCGRYSARKVEMEVQSGINTSTSMSTSDKNGNGNSNNGTSLTLREPLLHGASCAPVCNPGFHSTGTRSCMSGQLINTFVCLPKTCDASGTPEHGTSGDCTSTMSSGETCTPTCHVGYTQVSTLDLMEQKQKKGNATRDTMSNQLASRLLSSSSSSNRTQRTPIRTCLAGALTDTFACAPDSCTNADNISVWQQKSSGSCPNTTKGETLPHGISCVPECEVGLVPFGSRECRAGTLIDTFECLVPWHVAFASIGAGLLICCLMFTTMYCCRKTGCCCGCANDCAPGRGGDGDGDGTKTKITPRPRSEPSRMMSEIKQDDLEVKTQIEKSQEEHNRTTQARVEKRRRDSLILAESEAARLAAEQQLAATEEAARLEAERLAQLAQLAQQTTAENQATIDAARGKFVVAMGSNDPAQIQAVLDDVENDPEYVKEALVDEMEKAKAQLVLLSAALSAAEKEKLMKERVTEAMKDFKKIMVRVKRCRVEDKSYMKALPAAQRHIAALGKDPDLATSMAGEITLATSELEDKTKSIQLEILALIKTVMGESKNPNQYELLKSGLDSFDTFVPSMNAPDNEVMIREARKMLERLYEVWKLKQLLMNLDQKAIAQVKSMNTPIQEIVEVIRAMLLIIGEDPKKLKDWKSLRVNISQTGKQSLKRRIGAFTMDHVTDVAQAKCEKIMSKIDFVRVESVSSVVAIFFAFVKGALEVEQGMDADDETPKKKESGSSAPLPPLPPPGSPRGKEEKKSFTSSSPPPPPPPPGGPAF